MSAFDDAREKWSGTVNRVSIGALKAEGGTRGSVVTVGGANALPFLKFEGDAQLKPVIAMEVWDREPDDWPKPLMEALGDAVKNPAEWAKKCVSEFGAEMICLKLAGIHPDFGDASPSQAAGVVKSILAAVDVPLIILGCEHDEKDNEVLP
ncbi:MAG: acetyl-CoA decarbonylase/synthase complex subunit delta, partial [Verrucomicrobia bacterium]|nr:acetyl-CoA decarbonylase/synthase complex subunit delta [Verrucomicrobiota bacterium]